MAFLESFTELCTLLSNDSWEIFCAPTADRALAVLQETPIDLAVLDVGMPMLDGLQLLTIIGRRYPAIKLAVMTGNANEARRADSLASGAELFIEKPVTPDGIKVVFNMLNDLVSWTHREGFTGALRQVNLQEVIQMECVRPPFLRCLEKSRQISAGFAGKFYIETRRNHSCRRRFTARRKGLSSADVHDWRRISVKALQGAASTHSAWWLGIFAPGSRPSE